MIEPLCSNQCIEHECDVILGYVVTCGKPKWTFRKHSNTAGNNI